MKLNYKLYGNGKETVLFLHGWGADLNSFSFFCESLKNDYKILQVDHCGHGKSDKLVYPFFLFDYTLEIFKLLKMLSINKVNIVCHSFGARVAIMLCKYFNINVNKLIVIGGAGVKPKFNIFNKIKIYIYKLKKCLNKFKLFKFDLSKYGSADYKDLNKVEKKTFVNVVNYNQSNQLSFIKAKTLLVWGEHDKSTPLYMAKIMNKKIKNSTLKIIRGGDHFCFLKNKQIVEFCVLNFL